MNDYGEDITDYINKPDYSVRRLSYFLNNGSLGLLLGAGASCGFGLPSWKELVVSCLQSVEPDYTVKDDYTNYELKELIDRFKKKAGVDYITTIGYELYKKVTFDFESTQKDLLIAITALIIGRSRGNIRNVITYNFDCVLEWFLRINGLKVNVTTWDNLLNTNVDIDITHVHGFIPDKDVYGTASSDVVFSKKEFEDRLFGESYWKDLINQFFRRNIFLSIGLSPVTLIDDICPYLRDINKWYNVNKLRRGHPYGFAFVTPGLSDAQIEDLTSHGIIPCEIEIPAFPKTIFEIAQKAVLFK